MDIFTLVTLLCLATGGIALDGYLYPKTLAVDIVQRADDTGTGIDKGVVTGVVNYQVDRIAGIRSLLARPHIHPSDKKGFVGTLGDATGTSAFLNLISSVFQSAPNTLNFGVYSDGGKFKVFVFGSESSLPRLGRRFDLTVTQEEGETTVDTVRRATTAGAAHIDPYLAMLYLLTELEITGQERNGDDALKISDAAKSAIPPSAESLLLARLLNIEGLIQLRRGNLDLASAAMANGLSHVPLGNVGPTPVILQLNKAFVDVARNATDSAAALLAQLTASTNNFENLVGVNFATSEDIAYSLNRDEVAALRAARDTTAAYIALRRNRVAEAESILKQELATNATRLNAIALLADIEAMRGNQAAEHALREAAVQQSLVNSQFIEVALLHARLSFTAGTVALKSSPYILQ